MSLPVGTIRRDEISDGVFGMIGEFRLAGHPIYSGTVRFLPQHKASEKSPDYVVNNRGGDAIGTARLHRSPGKPANIQVWLHAAGFPEINLACFPPENGDEDRDEWRVTYIPRRDGAEAR